MFGNEGNNNLMDELIGVDAGITAGKRHINRKQLVEIVTAMRRDGDEVEEILDALRDYIVDFKNTVDRPMVLPIVQDVDDGKYGPPRKWLPRDASAVRHATGGIGASQLPNEPTPVNYQGMQMVQPMMAQTMGITEQIREMYFKYVEAFKTGDLDSAMFYKNAFNELLEMRNSMYPAAGFSNMGGQADSSDDWVKQLMGAMVSNMMQQNNTPYGQQAEKTSVFDDIEKLGKIKDVFGWGNSNSAGGLSENAAIAAMQVAAPEIGKLTDTVGQLVQTRQEGKKADRNQATYDEMQDREREIRANYTACPQCEAVIPKWAKQCHKCGVIFNDQFAGTSSDYGKELPQRRVANTQTAALPDPAMAGLVGGVDVPSNPPPGVVSARDESQMQEQMAQMEAVMQQQQTSGAVRAPYQMETNSDEDEWDNMTEAEIWFDTYYPRLEEWISQGADPRKKMQAIWALSSAHEQRQMLFLAQERGSRGVIEGINELVDSSDTEGAVAFLSQGGALGWLDAMFKEVKLMANEDNLILSANDIKEFNGVWESGAPGFRPPTQEELTPQMIGQVPRLPTHLPARDAPPALVESEPLFDPYEAPEDVRPPEPIIELKPPTHIEQASAISLKEKLRRKQLGHDK